MPNETDIQKLLVQRLQRRVNELEKEVKKLTESKKLEAAKNDAKNYLMKEELKEAWCQAGRFEREAAEAQRKLRKLTGK